MNKLTIASKILGAAVLGTIAIDAHRVGKSGSRSNQNNKLPNDLVDTYINSRKQEHYSSLGTSMKKWYVDKKMKTHLFSDWYSVNGYCSGYIKHLKDSVIPLGLAAGALCLKNTGSKVSAALLGIYGIKYFIFDVLQFGRPKYLNK